MQKKNLDHLKFYINNKISPVRQNVKKKKTHFERRESLYNYLGLTKKLIQNSRILEVAPAEGHNATYLAKCNAKEIVLVEPNPYAYLNIKKIFKKFEVSSTNLRIVTKKLENYNDKKKFDIVICEAWLGNKQGELELINKLGKFVNKDGFIVITSSNSIGFLSNIIRRFVAQNLVKKINNFKTKSQTLVKFYKKHLNTLKNMSCPDIDWVQDSLLGDGFLNIHPEPNIIFKKLGKKFNFHNSYPVFLNEWRWYKDLTGKNTDKKELFIKKYNENIINFIDYNYYYKNSNSNLNKKILKECNNLLKNLIKFEIKSNEFNYNSFVKNLNNVCDLLKENKIDMKGYENALLLLKKKKLDKFKNIKKFKNYFGRELMYLCCIKVKD